MFEILEKNIILITNFVNKSLSTEDLIENAKQEYKLIYKKAAPSNPRIEKKIKKLLNMNCPIFEERLNQRYVKSAFAHEKWLV